ncbi:MAG: hypothetical protein JJ693_03865 [Acidithiobacillus sp.]|nr:hypothetical protein [Acidithiobacillus sp.]
MMKQFGKKPLILGLLAAVMGLAGTGAAYAQQPEVLAANNPQVVVREAQLPGGGFVRMETIHWNNTPAQVRVERLTPEQAQALWKQSMAQFQNMQTALSQQLIQMQKLLSAAYFNPYGAMAPMVTQVSESPLFGVPFWVQISTPQIFGVEIPQSTVRIPSTPSQHPVSPQSGAPWPPHGTTAVGDLHPAAKNPKLPI